MWGMYPDSRITTKNSGTWNEMLQNHPWHLFHGPYHKMKKCETPSGNKVSHYEGLLTIVKKRKLKWYGHVTRANSLSTPVLQGSVQGVRRRGRQIKKCSDNIKEWTRKSFAETRALAHDRVEWRELVRCSAAQCLNDHTRSRDWWWWWWWWWVNRTYKFWKTLMTKAR